ncbi:MAG: arginase family protein [Candidatus Marinamargulisbacteria bacterium]
MHNKPVHIYSVPWDCTTTFSPGTANAPEQIAMVAHQMDVSHPFKAVSPQLEFLPILPDITRLQRQFEDPSRQIIDLLNHDRPLRPNDKKNLFNINAACEDLHNIVYNESARLIRNNSPFILCGGEHGVGVGYLRALNELDQPFSILQIDAHMDCRQAYFGYVYSHASVMTHYSSLSNVSRIVQVGIRDYDLVEIEFQNHQKTSFIPFFDSDMHRRMFRGESWHDIVIDIVQSLNGPVFVSFDVDGLMPHLCPNTGTPVAGGLSYNQVSYLFEVLYQSHPIIGAELVEVSGKSTAQYDASIGAQLLQLMAGLLV